MTCLTQLGFWMTNFQQLCNCEEGQGVAEYALLVCTVVFMVICSVSIFVGPLGELYTTIGLVFQSFANAFTF